MRASRTTALLACANAHRARVARSTRQRDLERRRSRRRRATSVRTDRVRRPTLALRASRISRPEIHARKPIACARLEIATNAPSCMANVCPCPKAGSTASRAGSVGVQCSRVLSGTNAAHASGALFPVRAGREDDIALRRIARRDATARATSRLAGTAAGSRVDPACERIGAGSRRTADPSPAGFCDPPHLDRAARAAARAWAPTCRKLDARCWPLSLLQAPSAASTPSNSKLQGPLTAPAGRPSLGPLLPAPPPPGGIARSARGGTHRRAGAQCCNAICMAGRW